jgi:putative nucleotidyltransferase with HDIG domain
MSWSSSRRDRDRARGETHPRTASLIDQFASADSMQFDPEQPEDSARHRLEALIQQLFDTTPQSSVALAVMQAADDDRVDARKLAGLIELDPFLALRVLRLANTAYYGQQQRVSTVKQAVGVIGFSAVRALSAMVAMGITEAQVPPRFLDHSARVAVGAGFCADLLDEPVGDSFSGGLLHDVGEALLFRCAPGLWSLSQDATEPLEAQVRMFGMHHQTAGLLVLQAWQLPQALLHAVSRHHDDAEVLPGVARAVAASEALVEGDFMRAMAIGIAEDDIDEILEVVDHEAAALHAWLQNR